MKVFGTIRNLLMRLQAWALLMCLLFGSLHGVVAVVLHTPDCCVNGICPLHRSHRNDEAASECDHEHGAKSDCALKCGMPKVDLAGILPTLPEMIFTAPDAPVALMATRFEALPVNVVVPRFSFSPPDQPPRS